MRALTRASFSRVPSLVFRCHHKAPIPRTSIPITTDNIHTDYNDEDTTVSFRFDAAQQFKVVFTREGSILLAFDTPRRTPSTASAFRKEFPLSLAIVPTLGPFEPDEEIAQPEYVARWARSHRAPRLFRNMWYYENEDFETFKSLIESSWPGMSISLPQRADTLSNRLVMFCSEERLTREITWIGYGFQVWLQLLTHIVKSRNVDVIIVDEPEIYLHPDLQRKIVQILKSIGPQILIATHSVENNK